MYEVLTLNKIAKCGLDRLDNAVFTVTDEVKNPDAIILRSFKMHDMELGDNLKCVARAGAGTNNIPIDKCSEKGVVVFNTPPTYTIYICKLVCEWLKENGGIDAMHKTNLKKAEILYSYLDSSEMFSATVADPKDRSLMNVPFVTDSDDLNAKFIKEAKEAGFVNLKGHRTVGGMRASIYNAMPVEGVQALVDFMKKFEAENA